jgi:hypothetical protein
MRRRSMWLISRHDVRLSGLPSLKGENNMSVKVPRGDYEWDNSCGGECYRVTVPKCSGGDSTAEPDIGILEENIRGCDWEMQLIFRGNDYMPVSIIYLKGCAGV